jgi:predicted phage tail protein
VAFTIVPPDQVASPNVTLAFTASDPAATTWCGIDGAAPAVCSSPLTLTGLADGPHVVSVNTLDEVGTAGPAIQATFTVDTTAPITTISAAPPSMLISSSASVSFSTDDPAASTWCSLDGAPAAACSSPATFTGLTDGDHTVSIHAVDALGNVGPSVTTAFTVDTTGPTVTSLSAPTGPVPSTVVSIPFTLDDAAATAWCSFDGSTPFVCASPVQSPTLTDGLHTIAVFGVDQAGNVGASAQASFTVDASAPTVTLGNYARLTKNSAISLDFQVDDPTATAWCSLDGASATACTSPVTYTGLSDGNHSVAVYAVSQAGISSATATAEFTVDTHAPVVSITSAPVGRLNSAGASLSHSVDDSNATVWCSIDGAAAFHCSGPLDLSGLADGSHTVTLHAVDPAGNVGPDAAASFTIDNTAPVVTITSAPPSSSANHNVSISFTTNDPSATTSCVLDNGTAQPCAGTASFSNLADGSHTVTIAAVDPAGNRASASVTFQIVGSAPVFYTTPPASSPSKQVTFTWFAHLDLSYQYSYDGRVWLPTSTHASNTNTLRPGTYTFHLRGVDAYGSVTAERTFTFVVK